MIGAVSALAILAIAFWYYQTADKLKLPILPWMAGGVIVYYLGFLFWMHLLLKPLLGGQFKEHNFLLGIFMDITAILAGAALAALFRGKVMLKQGKSPFESPF
ncbi:MAG: hypothetical protein PHE55_04140 [Methylococcaceae bacterium]|nr:hypothetical protein [Methylococcaceae bacterium]